MVKLLIIAAAILAVTFAAPVEKIRVPFYKLLAPREPFPASKIDETKPLNVTLQSLVQRLDNFDPSNTGIITNIEYKRINLIQTLSSFNRNLGSTILYER